MTAYEENEVILLNEFHKRLTHLATFHGFREIETDVWFAIEKTPIGDLHKIQVKFHTDNPTEETIQVLSEIMNIVGIDETAPNKINVKGYPKVDLLPTSRKSFVDRFFEHLH